MAILAEVVVTFVTELLIASVPPRVFWAIIGFIFFCGGVLFVRTLAA